MHTHCILPLWLLIFQKIWSINVSVVLFCCFLSLNVLACWKDRDGGEAEASHRPKWICAPASIWVSGAPLSVCYALAPLGLDQRTRALDRSTMDTSLQAKTGAQPPFAGYHHLHELPQRLVGQISDIPCSFPWISPFYAGTHETSGNAAAAVDIPTLVSTSS